MISLIIPTTTKNKKYTENILKNIREIYPDENQVEIILEENDNVTLGINYNNAVAKAKGDKIILLHNDMVLKPGFLETLDKHIIKNRITTYTRIEPPIFLDTYPGKQLLDCGVDLENFNKEKFNQFNIQESLIDGGSQLFFGCLKEDYIGIDGYNFKMFCEDDDIHLRYKLLGFEHKVSSAHVYHFVSKTSRSINNYQQIEQQSNINFIRKWGSRMKAPKYDIGFVIKGCSSNVLSLLEPWCSNIYVDEYLIDTYINLEQPNTKYDLRDRVKSINTKPKNDIIIHIDHPKFSMIKTYPIITILPSIIKDSGEIGEFELETLKIKISSLEEHQNKMIKLT